MSDSGGVRGRPPLLAAAAVVGALVVAGGVDYALTAEQVPEVPSACRQGDPSCQPPSTADFDQRLERAFELDHGLEARAWWYAAVALIALLVAIVVGWRRSAPGARRELFTDLGVGAVVWLLATLVIALASSGNLVEAPTDPMFVLGGLALVVAATGTLATRPGPEPRSASSRSPAAFARASARYSVWLGLALTLVAVVLGVIALTSYGDPCLEDEPRWLDPVLAVAGAAAVGAAVCGIIALLGRRWVVALGLLATGPFFALLGAFGSFCSN